MQVCTHDGALRSKRLRQSICVQKMYCHPGDPAGTDKESAAAKAASAACWPVSRLWVGVTLLPEEQTSVAVRVTLRASQTCNAPHLLLRGQFRLGRRTKRLLIPV